MFAPEHISIAYWIIGVLPALSSSEAWEYEDAKACKCLKYLTSCLNIFKPIMLARLYITCASFIACHKMGWLE